MLQAPDHVTVYNFRVYGPNVESFETAAYKATREYIESLGGEALPATAQEVPSDELDAQGRYRRMNTGWGGLN